jgi:zinc protease
VNELLLCEASLTLLRATLAAAGLLLASTSLAAPAPTTTKVTRVSPDLNLWMRGDGLRPDPELRIGKLANGMRFVIRRNQTPPGDASIRLHIDTGSLNEAEDQRGLAHFLEHMVLNGTENVPEGEFVKRLERAGLRFGPDTNASTGFGQTVFKLDLPETDKATVDTAFFLMREIAGRATIKADAVERERGIILSEERARATPAFRQLNDELAWLFPGQVLPNRLPIGTVDVIRNAPRQRLVDFYRAWYRPEKATLIVVGDIDPADVERRITTGFGDWRGVGPAGTPANQGVPKERATGASVFVDSAVAAGVRLAWVRQPDLQPDSAAKRARELEEQFAVAILNRRLEKLAQADTNPPFVSAALAISELEKTAETTSLGAVARLGNWRSALQAIEQEQRRLVQFGVTPDEVEREVTNSRTAIEASVAAASTRTSAALAEALVGAVDRAAVVTSPADRLAFFQSVAPQLTPERIGAAARRLFEGSGPLLYLTLPRPLGNARDALLASYAASQKVAVAAPVARERVVWPYERFGTPGTVAERREFAEVGATHVRFANGVRLTVRPSSTRKEQVLVQVRFGDGRLVMDPARTSLEWALGPGLTGGGTTKLDIDSINRALTGRLVGAGFDVADDRFVLAGGTRPADFATQMQLLAATMTDAAWRPTGWDRARTQANSIHDRFESTPGGILARDLGVLLRSGDRRWQLPGRAAMRASTISQGRALLEPALRDGPIEVIIVGDISVDRAIAETAATFGALPPRPPSRRTVGTLRFPSPPAEPVTLFHKGRADQAVGFIAWPTTGFSPETRVLARTLSLLGSVFQLRMTERLREAEGASYAPGAGSAASQVWPDHGYLAAQMEAPPEKLASFFAASHEIAADLASKPISEDELNRARRPTLEGIDRARDGNGYWLGALGDLGEDPFTLQTILTQRADLEAITPAALQEAARRFLLPSTAYRIRVVQGTPAAPGTPGGLPLPALPSR